MYFDVYSSLPDQGPKQAVGTITGMVLGGKIANDLTEDIQKIIYGHLLELH